MYYELDPDMQQEKVTIGRVSKRVMDLLALPHAERDIILWKDRIRYLEKHRSDFLNDEAFDKHLRAIPEIVNSPDYVGLHPKGDSIQFIKRIDELMLVAVRISNNRNWTFRSAYPISQETFSAYLEAGTVKKIDNVA